MTEKKNQKKNRGNGWGCGLGVASEPGDGVFTEILLRKVHGIEH